jgi:hypothetical protein
MRIMTHNVQRFLGKKSWIQTLLTPFRLILGYRKRQYLNIWDERKLKNSYSPDVCFIQDIYFKGKNKIPQIDLFRSELMENINTLTPYTMYQEKRFLGLFSNKEYSVAAFTKYPTNVVKMTQTSNMLETTMDNLSILSFNLSRRKKHRTEQLRFIEGYINHNIHRNFIIAGCFNITKEAELFSLIKHCSLYKAPLPPTYPVSNPKKYFSGVLYDNSISVSASNVIYESISDHLPIVVDCELRREIR